MLKTLKLELAHVINVGSKTTQLRLFNSRAFLNIGHKIFMSAQIMDMIYISCEFPFTKLFYIYKPLRSVEDIMADIKKLEESMGDALKNIMEG